jgi:6-phosphofructokinase 2
MIATITLNPCVDKHITVQGLNLNDTNRSTAIHHDAGGKGIDVSRAIHEMGGLGMAYGFIGGHDGSTLQSLLAEERVPFRFTTIDRETRSCFIINDVHTSQQTRISTEGPLVSKEEIGRFFGHLWDSRRIPDFIVAGGSVPPGCPADIYHTIIIEASKHGVKTILDSSGVYLREGIKGKPYLIKPNVRETIELLGVELKVEADIIKACLELTAGGIEIAVVSRGENGLIAASDGGIIRTVPPAVKVVSDVGAGDCAVAGLALKLAEGGSLLEACRLATAMGTAAVLTPGTELCRRVDVEWLLPQISVQEVTA